MRTNHIAIILFVVLSIASAAGHRQEAPASVQGETESAIRAVHVQMRHAAEKLDVATLYSYVLDTATPPIIENGRVAATRADALARTTAGVGQVTSLSYTYTRESMTSLSPTMVLWVGEGSASATLRDGRAISAPFAETLVFVQRDGQWKVLHAHRSSPNAR